MDITIKWLIKSKIEWLVQKTPKLKKWKKTKSKLLQFQNRVKDEISNILLMSDFCFL